MIFASGVFFVPESDVRSDENFIPEASAVPKVHARLHCHSVPDSNVVLNEGVVTDVAVFTNCPPRIWANAQTRERAPIRAPFSMMA
jgi:hypothetical protein